MSNRSNVRPQRRRRRESSCSAGEPGGWHRLRSCIRTYLGRTCARLRLIQARMQECRRDRDPGGEPRYSEGERERRRKRGEESATSGFRLGIRSSGKTFTRLVSAVARRVRPMNALRSSLSTTLDARRSPSGYNSHACTLSHRRDFIYTSCISRGWIRRVDRRTLARTREQKIMTPAVTRENARAARTSR